MAMSNAVSPLPTRSTRASRAIPGSAASSNGLRTNRGCAAIGERTPGTTGKPLPVAITTRSAASRAPSSVSTSTRPAPRSRPVAVER
ncbi:MAG TPA: hypothetical protein VF038_04335 [Usitatibacter sp.]